MKTRLTTLKGKPIKIAVAVFFLTTAWICRQPLAELIQFVQDQEAVSAYVQGYGALGPVVLFALLIAQVFIAIIPGHVLMVAAGYAYGPLGLFVTILSTVLGSQVAFLIARNYGRSLIFRIASPHLIEHWDRVAKHQGILFYFFSFVLPIFPSDLMCYVAGLGHIAPRRFFVANLMGRTCCAVFITLIGIYGLQPPIQFWIVSLTGLAALFLGWAMYKHSCNQFGGNTASCINR